MALNDQNSYMVSIASLQISRVFEVCPVTQNMLAMAYWEYQSMRQGHLTRRGEKSLTIAVQFFNNKLFSDKFLLCYPLPTLHTNVDDDFFCERIRRQLEKIQWVWELMKSLRTLVSVGCHLLNTCFPGRPVKSVPRFLLNVLCLDCISPARHKRV